jgi:hypothetical protein
MNIHSAIWGPEHSASGRIASPGRFFLVNVHSNISLWIISRPVFPARIPARIPWPAFPDLVRCL